MPILAAKPINMTKLDGPPMAAGLIPATITAVKDLGMVTVNPAFAKTPGEQKHKVEIIFTAADGSQARREYTLSLHEKSSLVPLIVAATGQTPTESFDVETLIGKNLTLITTQQKSKVSGNLYAKVSGVGPASPNQPVAKAPAPRSNQAPATQNVGW
jgi:hypothetical protein